MTAMLDRYLTALATHPNRRGRRPTPATLRAARADLQGFIAWWQTTHRLTFDLALVMDEDLRAWQAHRQLHDGARTTTINRASSTLRGFFAWALANGLIHHNPAAALPDLAIEDLAPRGTPPEGVEWLFRVVSAQPDATARHRDLALLTLLSDCGLRSQEAADLQLRDVDPDREYITVRAGKGGRARRVPLEGTGTLRRLREYMALRRPEGAPPIGSDAEREPFLLGQRVDLPGQPWRPGMQTAAMRKRLAELRDVAVQKIAAQIAKERSLERIGELEDLARELAATSPHRLRHGLAYRLLESGATPAYVKTIFGHSRISTSLMYGKPTEQDVRAALARANSRPGRT